MHRASFAAPNADVHGACVWVRVCVGMCPGMCVAVCWRVCGHTDVYKRVSAAVAEWMASTPLISPALAECEA